MDIFDLSWREIPSVLYRVQYSESATIYDVHEGLEARDMDTLYEEEDSLPDFCDAVEQHLSWDQHYMSIFISLFVNRTHAENWMLERHSRFRSRNCMLLEINTAELRDYYVFRAEELVDTLSLSISERARDRIAGDYLVVHHIPPVAIIGRHTIHDIEMGRSLLF